MENREIMEGEKNANQASCLSSMLFMPSMVKSFSACFFSRSDPTQKGMSEPHFGTGTEFLENFTEPTMLRSWL